MVGAFRVRVEPIKVDEIEDKLKVEEIKVDEVEVKVEIMDVEVKAVNFKVEAVVDISIVVGIASVEDFEGEENGNSDSEVEEESEKVVSGAVEILVGGIHVYCDVVFMFLLVSSKYI